MFVNFFNEKKFSHIMNKRIPIGKLFYLNLNRQQCQHNSIDIIIFIKDEKLP